MFNGYIGYIDVAFCIVDFALFVFLVFFRGYYKVLIRPFVLISLSIVSFLSLILLGVICSFIREELDVVFDYPFLLGFVIAIFDFVIYSIFFFSSATALSRS